MKNLTKMVFVLLAATTAHAQFRSDCDSNAKRNYHQIQFDACVCGTRIPQRTCRVINADGAVVSKFSEDCDTGACGGW